MEITPSSKEGLQREWKINVPAEELSQRLESRLLELRAKTRLKGFRPGKVPVSHLRRLYGASLMNEIIDGVMQETGKQILEQENLRPAMRPHIELDTDAMAGGLEAVQKGEGNLAYKMSLEVIPEITLQDFGTLKLTRPMAKVSKKDVEQALERLAKQRRAFAPREAKSATAQEGDRVRLDFDGMIDGEKFPGGEGRDVLAEIPPKHSDSGGFEKELLGKKKGKSKLEVTFPEDYPDANLAGKKAKFDIDVKEISAPEEVTIDEDFATGLGVKNLEELRKQISDALAQEDNHATRAKMKRQLLDQLAEQYSFDLPGGMVSQELEAIRAQISQEHAPQEGDAQPAISEEELQKEYAPIAERRVRLALLMSEIGRRNNIQVTSDELQRAIAAQAQRFPGEEQKLYAYYREHPEALENIRAPMFEDKVTDFLFELAKIEDKEVTREELFREDEEEVEAAAEKPVKKAKKATKSTKPKKTPSKK